MAKTNIFDKALLDDDALRFISERHNTTTLKLLTDFIAQGSAGDATSDSLYKDLERNEIVIIRDMINLYNQ